VVLFPHPNGYPECLEDHPPLPVREPVEICCCSGTPCRQIGEPPGVGLLVGCRCGLCAPLDLKFFPLIAEFGQFARHERGAVRILVEERDGADEVLALAVEGGDAPVDECQVGGGTTV